MRALGIDPGTKNFDICCIEDDTDKVVLDASIPSESVAREPEKVFDLIESADADVIVGPSGYGLEFKHISKFTREDLGLTTLDKRGDVDIPVLSGLRKLLVMMKEAKLNAYSLPGVVQLPTIPLHRKMNKIDMGTADKTCVTAFAIWDQAREHAIPYDRTSLICVEMGFGYNAAMAVEGGKIIDALGGTIFPGPGYLTLSLMDGELAYLLGGFSKLKLFQGGASFIASNKVVEPEEFAETISEKETFSMAWRTMLEGIVKAIAMLYTSFEGAPKEVLLTGRLSRIRTLFDGVEEVVRGRFSLDVRRPKIFTKSAKDVAQGAALIANGIQGGRYRDLVDIMEIEAAKGTVLDYVAIGDFDKDEIIKGLRTS